MTVSQVTANPQSINILSGRPWRSYGAVALDQSRRCAAAAARLIRTAITESQLRRAARELRRLDDRMLRDIGLSRSEIDTAVRGVRDRDLAPLRARFGLAP